MYDLWLPPSRTIPTFWVREESRGLDTSVTAVCKRTILLEPAYSVLVPDGTAEVPDNATPENGCAPGFSGGPPVMLLLGVAWEGGGASDFRSQMLTW